MDFQKCIFYIFLRFIVEIWKKTLPLQKNKVVPLMRLIVETGSFTEWAIIDKDKVIATANTEMVNPFSQSRREISRLIRLTLPENFFHKKYEKVFYYGSGCSTEQRKKKVEASLITQFKAHVTVESTLLATARGLLQDNAGIACVLGNRSGSCHYDGSKITAQVLSGGYLLGDEGSSIVLGRMFLADVVKNMAPSELSVDFYQHFRVSANSLQDFVYEMKEPDLFLAEVSIYLKEHKEHPYMRSLVGRNFKEFFERCILQYDYKNLPICAVGHMAQDFKGLLEEVAMIYGARLVKSTELTPMKGLVKYHLKHPEL